MSINVNVTYNSSNILTLSNQSSVAITYGGGIIATLSSAGTKTLNCQDKLMSTDVGVGSKILNCSGQVMASNVVVTATNATYYLIMNGAMQVGNFTSAGKKWNSSSTANEAAPVVTYSSGYVQVEARGSGTYKGQGIVYFPNKFNLSNYTKLHVEGQYKNATGSSWHCCVDAWTSIGTYQENNRVFCNQISTATSQSSYTNFSINVNLSSYTSDAYIGFNFQRNNSQSSGVRLTNVWLE